MTAARSFESRAAAGHRPRSGSTVKISTATPSSPATSALRTLSPWRARIPATAARRPDRSGATTVTRGGSMDESAGTPWVRTASITTSRSSVISGAGGADGLAGQQQAAPARPGRPPGRPSSCPRPRGRWPGCRPRPGRPGARGSGGRRPRRPPCSTVAGSSRSRRVAVSGSSRWRRTMVTRVATSSGGKPIRAAMSAASTMPTSVWSPGKPLPMSWSRVPTSSRSGRSTRWARWRRWPSPRGGAGRR